MLSFVNKSLIISVFSFSTAKYNDVLQGGEKVHIMTHFSFNIK